MIRGSTTHEVSIDRARGIVVKKFRSADRDEPAREWAALKLLARHAPGLAPAPVRADLDAAPATIEMTWLPGTELGGPTLTPAQTQALAAALDRLWSCVPSPRGHPAMAPNADRLTAKVRSMLTAGTWPAAFTRYGPGSWVTRSFHHEEHQLSSASFFEQLPNADGQPSRIARHGSTVVRPAGPWIPAVHALLRYLERAGFAGSPRVAGDGYDDQGREVVTYIEGTFVHPHAWTDEGVWQVGQLLRDLHDATAGFQPPPDAAWHPWTFRSDAPGAIISHCDAGPWNIVARDGLPAASTK